MTKNRKTIFVADDNELICRLAEDILPDYNVRCFKDGSSLEKALNEQGREADIIITDNEMPGISGLDITKKFSEKIKVPIIVVSGRVDDYNKTLEKTARDYGAYTFLEKPQGFCRLPEVVKEALENPRYNLKDKDPEYLA